MDDGYFVAVADGEYVGVSSLWRADEPDLLRTGLTGVRRAYRRRGHRLRAQVGGARIRARQPGIRASITDNASSNRPMLAINEALGFAKTRPGSTTARRGVARAHAGKRQNR